jgi:2-iminobutanoate/2-iminopropanoate deaminase
MLKKIIETSAAPRAIGPYSQAIQAGGFVFISGQIPLDPATGDLVSGSVEEETARVLDNIRAILEAAGLGMGDVVKTTVYLTDLGDFGRVNEVYSRYFESQPPARATVQVAALPRGVRVEIEAIAAAGKG